ncbi:hypothetical protein [Vibrio syngnathi]|uniref:Pullulanase n=1 Tax=Vibrio syngnathi TaxID=3034029 RepID=A0AA34TLT1_9VIBR|nr:hypothetical protein [Vibrio syngnathi]ARP37251.1 hypothetical protein K08M4_04540 [Vibrio syngnathi]
MSGYPATHLCKKCNKETPHSEVLVRKDSSYDIDHSVLGRIKLFVHSIVNGGHYYDMDRYVKCKVCGTQEVDSWGNEFE